MTQTDWNLLTQPMLHATPAGWLTLPGLLACLVRDEVDSFPALRPHQSPAWHMFLVQLAALAQHRAEAKHLPETEAGWSKVLRGLTLNFPHDEPWRLVVNDWNKPGFLQAPVPTGISLKTQAPTPDSLDLLITSRNHDLKRQAAREADAQDWVLALVSLQTGEGYGGFGNQGIARMNGGSSSRPMLGLAPLSQKNSASTSPRFGDWFRRDVGILLASREEEWNQQSFHGYPATGGLGVTWIAPWKEGQQLGFERLDLWFIEVCRRVRLKMHDGRLSGQSGNSSAPRTSAKHWKGAVGDPWAPEHVTEGKGFTLAGRNFSYLILVDILFSGYWKIPLLARPAAFESCDQTMLLIAEALSRGNSKTEGFKSRVLSVDGKIAHAFNDETKRKELHKLAQQQIEQIAKFDKALRNALALAAAGGKYASLQKEHYLHSNLARTRFDHKADEIFFEHLWASYKAKEESGDALKSEADRFARALFERASSVFEAALPGIPCQSLFRPRGEVRARSTFLSLVRVAFPELFPPPTNPKEKHAVT